MSKSEINRRSLILAAPAAGLAAVAAPAVALVQSPEDRFEGLGGDLIALLAPYSTPETSQWWLQIHGASDSDGPHLIVHRFDRQIDGKYSRPGRPFFIERLTVVYEPPRSVLS